MTYTPTPVQEKVRAAGAARLMRDPLMRVVAEVTAERLMAEMPDAPRDVMGWTLVVYGIEQTAVESYAAKATGAPPKGDGIVSLVTGCHLIAMANALRSTVRGGV